MNYHDQLRAKIEAATLDEVPKNQTKKITTDTLQLQIFEELDDEFEFARYDLDQSDLLRSLKVMHILREYDNAFSSVWALHVFYVLARMEVIVPKDLLNYLQLDRQEFKRIINALARAKLIFKNSHNELELTMQGKSLAERLGIKLFF